jgi:serine/threonine kinase 32
VHELEELLFEDAPLRPHKKTESKIKNDTMKELLEMDDMFLPYDYTKYQQQRKIGIDDDDSNTKPLIVMPSPSSSSLTADDLRRNSPTPNNLLRRVGSALDQTRYKNQGYSELSKSDDTPTTVEAVSNCSKIK